MLRERLDGIRSNFLVQTTEPVLTMGRGFYTKAEDFRAVGCSERSAETHQKCAPDADSSITLVI